MRTRLAVCSTNTYSGIVDCVRKVGGRPAPSRVLVGGQFVVPCAAELLWTPARQGPWRAAPCAPCRWCCLRRPVASVQQHWGSLGADVYTPSPRPPAPIHRHFSRRFLRPQVLAQEGWRAFYRGMVPSMLGILPYAGVDITIFELLKERLLDEVGPQGVVVVVGWGVRGGGALPCGRWCGRPIEVVPMCNKVVLAGGRRKAGWCGCCGRV